jgi:hypothetical protein
MITGTHNGLPGLTGKGVKYVEKVFNDPRDNNTLDLIVLKEYIKQFGERLGISEFYKQYFCSKLLDKDYIGFELPIINSFISKSSNEWMESGEGI